MHQEILFNHCRVLRYCHFPCIRRYCSIIAGCSDTVIFHASGDTVQSLQGAQILSFSMHQKILFNHCRVLRYCHFPCIRRYCSIIAGCSDTVIFHASGDTVQTSQGAQILSFSMHQKKLFNHCRVLRYCHFPCIRRYCSIIAGCSDTVICHASEDTVQSLQGAQILSFAMHLKILFNHRRVLRYCHLPCIRRYCSIIAGCSHTVIFDASGDTVQSLQGAQILSFSMHQEILFNHCRVLRYCHFPCIRRYCSIIAGCSDTVFFHASGDTVQSLQGAQILSFSMHQEILFNHCRVLRYCHFPCIRRYCSIIAGCSDTVFFHASGDTVQSLQGAQILSFSMHQEILFSHCRVLRYCHFPCIRRYCSIIAGCSDTVIFHASGDTVQSLQGAQILSFSMHQEILFKHRRVLRNCHFPCIRRYCSIIAGCSDTVIFHASEDTVQSLQGAQILSFAMHQKIPFNDCRVLRYCHLPCI